MRHSPEPLSTHILARRGRRLFILLVVILLVSLACAVPNIPALSPGQPAATITPIQLQPQPAGTPGAQAPGAQPQGGQGQAAQGQAAPAPGGQLSASANLPPALVEVQPQPQSEISPTAAPVFYFNQPMERASVEAAFSTQPKLPGRFEWLDDATLRYVPGQPIRSGLNVTISSAAKAANGLALPAPVQVSYPPAGPLRLAERLPAPDAKDVNPASAVVVTFNRPVVALGADSGGLPPAFALDPPANGRAEWLNTSTYIFYPQPALQGGKQYTIRLNAGLTGVDGSTLASDTSLTWSFSTSAPVLLSVKPGTEQPVPLDSAFVLTFNQPMDTASVEGDFSLLGPGGPVAGAFSWNSTSMELTFKPKDLLQRGSSYTLALFGSARSLGGAALGRDFAASLTTVPQFAVTQTRPAAGQVLDASLGYGMVTLTFSAPVAAGQDYTSLVSLNPSITGQVVSRDLGGYALFVSGYFLPSTSYTLTVSPALSDRWGAKLDAPYSFTFTSQPARPALVIPILQAGFHALFVPASETSIQARTTNINRLALSRGQLGLEDFIRAEQDYQGLQNWEPKIQSTWPVILYPTPNVSENTSIPLTQNVGPLEPGLYFLKIDTQPLLNEGATSRPVLLVVSSIQLVLKVSANQAFVWAVRVPENTPAANAPVTVYDSAAAPLGTCKTDAQGMCRMDITPKRDQFKPVYAATGQPGSPDFSLAASTWYTGVSPWDFGLSYQNQGDQPQVYLYTDRPIYRPGQAVNFRVILRGQDNGRYSAAPLKQVTIGVASPYDPVTGQSQVLTTIRLPLDVYGSASGIYTLPDDARPGSYTLSIQDMELKSIYFEVAEYRKPEIDLQVKFTQPDELAGKDVQAQVSARYFFGAPAGNLTAHWSLFRRPGYPNLPGGFSIGKVDTGWLSPWAISGQSDIYVMDGQVQVGPDGLAQISISGQDLLDRAGAGNLQNLTLEVTVEDESGLPVSARGTMRLHPSPYYIGVRPEQWSVPAGGEITYTIRSVDWPGNPVADKPLTARFLKVKWVQQEATSPLAPPDYRPEYTEVGSTDFRTSPQGEARLAFIPAEPGTFMLEVSGEGGALTQALTWVSGPGATEWPNLANQRILLRSDSEGYKPGQTAHVFVPNPFEGGALALITTERGKVMRSMVVQVQGSSYDLQLPLTIDDAPNIFVSVTLLGKTDNRPDFRVGYVELAVDPSALELQVEVQTSPEQPQPGGEVTVYIRVKDAAGKPVQGEFSLALIDKAVLALADPNTPSIVAAFYGRQPLGVQSSFSLVDYSGRSLYLPPGRGGGGGGEGQAVPPVRTNFADTAYWNGAIQTDVTGTAQVTFTLPDNLTTWQADVRGLTADNSGGQANLVGQAVVDLVASKPLLVRPVAPRFVVPGDHLALEAVVHNNTQAALQPSVRLEASGFTLDDPNQAVQRIDLPAGGRGQVTWWGTVQDVPSLDLTFSAEATTPASLTLRDAAQPEGSPLPVLSYSASQTFGTSGLLVDASERQELVSLPRSFTPTGGELRLELSPSLSAAVIDGLKALEAYPHDFTEPILSRLLPNLATYQALKDLKLENAPLSGSLESAVTDSVDRLVRLQNENGGWGWAAGYASDPYISAYALFGLNRAAQSGVFVDPKVLQRGIDYLTFTMIQPANQPAWELDRLAFQYFALQQAGQTDLNLAPLYGLRDKLSPWGKAFLAMVLEAQSPGDTRARTLISDLAAAATRSSTGASWQDPSPAWHNWSTPNFTTAIVAYAIARVDPASPVLADAVRYLIHNRRAGGAWNSSYETSWTLLALVEALRGTGDLQANYTYSASLNGAPAASGKVENPAQAVNPVTSTVPFSSLRADAPNQLTIQRGAGSGRLYYRAFLQVDRPAQDAPAVARGLSISRQYYRAGQDCRKETCAPVDSVDLGDPQSVLVRLTLTVPEDMYFVVVEDTIPAGTEILNPRLKTSQQNIVPAEGQPEQPGSGQQPPYSLENPFDQGWGWWLFKDPQVYDDHIRWVVDSLPAGTYELTYRLTPFLAGEFRVIPARAWQYYFPDVEGSSKGGLLNIR